MANLIQELEKKTARAVEQIQLPVRPAMLFEPIRYLLSLGGKRLRPVLALMAADLFGKEPETVLEAAMGIEIFHNFSLMHDDLMDRADLRRGQQTVHKKWNDNVAILSGDAMLIEAYKHISNVPSHMLPEILSLFSATALEVCRGQQYDMDFEQRIDVTEAEYIEMIRLKTAVLIACSLKMGAVIAGASASDADILYEYGINIGLAFQLKDDLLDVYGNPETFGKRVGGDILCNKKTYLLIKALKNSNASQRKELEKWLSARVYDDGEKIEAVKKIYDELNLKAISENLIEKYYLASLDCLSAVHMSNERKKELIALSENLMYREK